MGAVAGMSAATGRMSRKDATGILMSIQSTVREFLTEDAPLLIRDEASVISALREHHQQVIDSGAGPDARGVRDLKARLAALQWDRLASSTREAPRVTSAAVVTLYGLGADQMQDAASIAERQLGAPVRLQDSTHIRTATLTGTRYIFTTRNP